MVKPTHIQFTNGNVTEYINSADGMKLRTIHRTAVIGHDTQPVHPFGIDDGLVSANWRHHKCQTVSK